jgi:hypothetical protein
MAKVDRSTLIMGTQKIFGQSPALTTACVAWLAKGGGKMNRGTRR